MPRFRLVSRVLVVAAVLAVLVQACGGQTPRPPSTPDQLVTKKAKDIVLTLTDLGDGWSQFNEEYFTATDDAIKSGNATELSSGYTYLTTLEAKYNLNVRCSVTVYARQEPAHQAYLEKKAKILPRETLKLGDESCIDNSVEISSIVLVRRANVLVDLRTDGHPLAKPSSKAESYARLVESRIP